MATTTHDDGFHEIQLNGKQLVFLFMAGTVVAVVIFLLGVFVGRGVRTQLPGAEFVAQDSPEAAPEIPAVAGSSGGNPPATASLDVGYPKQLGDPNPPREALESPRTAPPANIAAAPASTEKPATTADASRASAAPAAAKASRPTAASSVATEPAGDGFAIQLAALGKREEAEGIVRRLTDKGYKAYLMAPASGAPSVYRVRVGKFKDRREAESVSSRLQKEEQFKPWIVR